ncbi:MAG: AraC family transcriptional regulator [Armatimonadetes bacterium]|nr:AraC family transcriptional regulator [Armatimonadota bacterium]
MSSLIAALLLAVAQVMAGSEAQLAFESRGPGPCETIVQSALRYISDNLDRPSLSVSEIAMHFGVSPRHLSRLFARFISMSPTDYIMRSRLDRSRSLLIHTDIPIKEVVALTGYSDVQYFTRLFTRRFECPPARYRRKMEPYVYNLSQVTPP